MQPATFSFNAKIGNLGYSPFQLLYGYQPRSAIQNLILPSDFNNPAEPSKLLFLRNEKLDEMRLLATEKQLKNWEKRVEEYNRGLIKHRYFMGDLVLFQNYAKKGKFGKPWEDKWRGPVKITKVSTKGKIDFESVDGTKYKGWHADRIKPFILREMEG